MRLLAWRLLYPFLSPSVVVFVISMPQFDSDAQSLRVGSIRRVAGGLSHSKRCNRFQFAPFGALGEVQIPPHLQVQPEIGGVAKVLRQPQC